MSTEAMTATETTDEATEDTGHGDAYEGETYDDGTGEGEGEGGEDLLRAGIYKGRVVAGSGSDEHWGEGDGGPQVALDIDLVGVDRRVTAYLSFSEKAKPFSIDRLKACGWDGSATLPFVGIDANEIDVEIKYETYKGKTSMKVNIRTFGRFKHALEPAKARSFMADLVKNAGKIDKLPPAGGTRSAPSSQAKGATSYPADWDKDAPTKAADPARAGKVDL